MTTMLLPRPIVSSPPAASSVVPAHLAVKRKVPAGVGVHESGLAFLKKLKVDPGMVASFNTTFLGFYNTTVLTINSVLDLKLKAKIYLRLCSCLSTVLEVTEEVKSM